MTTKRYNLDERFLLRNKISGEAFINDPDKKKIYKREKLTGKLAKIADFCFTDIVWNESNKDIDKITLDGSASTEYTLSSNSGALKNRIFKESYTTGGQVIPSSPDKKYMHFAVNNALYEFILLIVRAIENGELIVGLTGVVLAITSSDTASFTNGTVVVTATDEDGNAVQGLKLSGTIGETEITGTTDSSGQVSETLTSAGTFAISVETEATNTYKAATKTGSVTVTAIEQGGTE